MGDPVLGTDALLRFLPSRFTNEGNAIDAKGKPCNELACPRCHLEIPRSLLVSSAVPIVMAGAHGSGQSFLLASMTRQLRQILPLHFDLTLTDADPRANASLFEEENRLLLQQTRQLKEFEKSDRVSTATIAGETVQLLRPYLLGLQPPQAELGPVGLVSLYTLHNESFFRRIDSRSYVSFERPLTYADGVIFLFDPTLDPRIRRVLQSASSKQQFVPDVPLPRQDSVLRELATQMRKLRLANDRWRMSGPLVVAVTKFDIWAQVIGWDILKQNWILNSLNVSYLREVSDKLQNFLSQYAPEIVATAASMAEDVLYVPVSALGDSDRAAPMWTEVPMLYVLHRAYPTLIPASQRPTPIEAINAVGADRTRRGVESSPPVSDEFDETATDPGRPVESNMNATQLPPLEHVEFTVYHPSSPLN